MHQSRIDARGNRLGRGSTIAGALGGLALLIGGCASLPPAQDVPPAMLEGSFAEASNQFSQRIQCPVARVAVRIEERAVKPPPPDVAADPARRAIYDEQMLEELRTTRLFYVSGCGQGGMYRCAVRATSQSGWRVACAMIEAGKLGFLIVAATRTVERVEPGGLAERIGFRVGDVFVGLEHRPITDWADCVRQIVDPQSPGHVVTVQRGGATVDLSVPRLGD